MSTETLHLPLQGKTALVTGGTRGIGAEIAYELGKRGADIITIHSTSKSQPLAQEVLQRISSLPNAPRVLTVCGNLRQSEDPEKVLSSIKEWFASTGRETRIDILVNNAGVEIVKPLGAITPEDFSHVYDLNVRGALLMTQAVLPHLPAQGRIINISSVGSRVGFPSLGLYCSSKAALEGLTRCWAAELGGNGTTVNAVNPGPVESEMLANIPKDIVEKQKEGTPVEKRVGRLEDVSAVVGWLAGEEARWVTGQCISASGGWAMY